MRCRIAMYCLLLTILLSSCGDESAPDIIGNWSTSDCQYSLTYEIGADGSGIARYSETDYRSFSWSWEAGGNSQELVFTYEGFPTLLEKHRLLGSSAGVLEVQTREFGGTGLHMQWDSCNWVRVN